jgi:hypothetical protein
MPREMSYEGKLKQNRGKIDLKHPENYIPWILAGECLKGDGTRYQIPDLYYPSRTIHLMSGLEKDIYYKLRGSSYVLELFEQYPLLPLGKTELLCNQTDVRHPRHPITKKNVAMTTDFLLIIKDRNGIKRWIACAVKQSSAMEDGRTREKLFIEKVYWESMGISWGCITEKDINKTFVRNIILCRSGYSGLGDNSIYDAIKYLIIHEEIDVDWYKPINLDELIIRKQNGELKYGSNIYNE